MLRPIRKADLEMILSWRNQPFVRESMFNKHKISRKEHFEWYEKIINDKTKSYFIYGTVETPSLGVVYFDAIDFKNRFATWGFYTGNCAPPGTGTLMAIDAIDLAFKKIKLKELKALVLKTNLRSWIFYGFICC